VKRTGKGFCYPQVKARRYVEVGPETYRRPNFLRRPDAGMSEEDRPVMKRFSVAILSSDQLKIGSGWIS
jgi:hypothetical protein